jgi:hypothetical protein
MPAPKRTTFQVQLVPGAAGKDGLVLEMIGLPAGEFMMEASPGDEKASPTEEFRRKVRLSRPFYLGTLEITDQHWRFATGKNPNPETANLPAASMTWAEANDFAALLTKRYASRLPQGMVFRVPTDPIVLPINDARRWRASSPRAECLRSPLRTASGGKNCATADNRPILCSCPPATA